ncbi:hypothetical protein MMC17_005254 [Xylographa soralifera]|nr:hypothetical protein [Xylographa soralifera]
MPLPSSLGPPSHPSQVPLQGLRDADAGHPADSSVPEGASSHAREPGLGARGAEGHQQGREGRATITTVGKLVTLSENWRRDVTERAPGQSSPVASRARLGSPSLGSELAWIPPTDMTWRRPIPHKAIRPKMAFGGIPSPHHAASANDHLWSQATLTESDVLDGISHLCHPHDAVIGRGGRKHRRAQPTSGGASRLCIGRLRIATSGSAHESAIDPHHGQKGVQRHVRADHGPFRRCAAEHAIPSPPHRTTWPHLSGVRTEQVWNSNAGGCRQICEKLVSIRGQSTMVMA